MPNEVNAGSPSLSIRLLPMETPSLDREVNEVDKKVSYVEMTISKEFKVWGEEFRVLVERLDDLMSRIPLNILEATAAEDKEDNSRTCC